MTMRTLSALWLGCAVSACGGATEGGFAGPSLNVADNSSGASSIAAPHAGSAGRGSGTIGTSQAAAGGAGAGEPLSSQSGASSQEGSSRPPSSSDDHAGAPLLPLQLATGGLHDAVSVGVYASGMDQALTLDHRSVEGDSVIVEVEGARLLGAVLVAEPNSVVDVALASTCGQAPVAASELHVPADFPTIQAAIDAAAYGDTVRVASGVYGESLQLRSGVRLVGAGALTTTLEGDGSHGHLIDFTGARDTVVRGFTLRGIRRTDICRSVGGCSGNWYRASVYGDGSDETAPGCGPPTLFLTQNILTDNEIAVMVYFHARAVVANNLFIANHHAFVANHHQDHSLVVNNVFYANTAHAIFAQASYLDVANNVFANNGTAFEQEYIQRGTVRCNLTFGNTVLGNGFEQHPPLSVDPGFVDAEKGDFRLTLESSVLVSACRSNQGLTVQPGAYGGPLGAW